MNRIIFWLAASALIGCACMASAEEGTPAASASCKDIPIGWSTLGASRPHATDAAELLAAMAERDVVLLGEFHDEDDDHRWQVQTLAALYLFRPNMVIGFEMFPRRMQPVLDRWIAGDLTVKQFLEQSEWGKNWNIPFDMYLPLFQFARINRIPVVALNVDQKLSKAIAERGWDGVPEAEREGVGRAAQPVKAYIDFLLQSYREHPGMQDKDAGGAQKTGGRFIESQTAWDRAMGEALAHQVMSRKAGDKPLAVGVMGSGHIRFGYGVPYQLRDLGLKNIGTLVPLHIDSDCSQVRTDFADAVFVLPLQAEAKPVPPRLGVSLEERDGGVRLVQVTPGSLAERMGLKMGDRLLEVGGAPVKGVSFVIASVQRQPGGSWLPMRVQRVSETLDLVIKFPPEP